MTTSEPLTGSTNELAKERTRAAAERTLSTWINNCLVLIGFGVAIDQIYGDLERLLSRNDAWANVQLAHTIGLLFIALGIGLLLIAMVQHLFILRFLTRSRSIFKAEHFLKLNQVTAAAVLVFGLVSMVIIWLTPA